MKGVSLARRILFICGKNRRRSPTAEQLFSDWEALEVTSAGVDADADIVVGPELLEWAEMVFVMEASHRTKLSTRFRSHLNQQRVIVLDIPDRFEYMDPELVQMLIVRVTPHLGAQEFGE